MSVLAEEKIILSYLINPDRGDGLYFKLYTSSMFLSRTAKLLHMSIIHLLTLKTVVRWQVQSGKSD